MLLFFFLSFVAPCLSLQLTVKISWEATQQQPIAIPAGVTLGVFSSPVSGWRGWVLDPNPRWSSTAEVTLSFQVIWHCTRRTHKKEIDRRNADKGQLGSSWTEHQQRALKSSGRFYLSQLDWIRAEMYLHVCILPESHSLYNVKLSSCGSTRSPYCRRVLCQLCPNDLQATIGYSHLIVVKSFNSSG